MKILLVEDDLQTSDMIAATLLAHCYTVDAIADGAMGLEMAMQWEYDLILLDLLLPHLTGFEVCRQLRAQGRQTPILMLTARDSTEDIVAGLDVGADDYLVKSCDSAQLLARVRALLRRSGSVSASPILTWELLELDPASARVTYDHAAIALRPKEYALLELFLRYPQRIFSRSAIIDHLWSAEDTPVEGVITNLIKDLRHRLKFAGMQADLIETVYGLGYRLREVPTAKTSSLEAIAAMPAEVPADSVAAIAHDQEIDRELRELQGRLRIQQITERFQGSLTQRIATLEAVRRSLQAGHLSLPERQAAHTEAHKLAGGLGTFGSGRASEVAQAIEDLFAESLKQEAHLAHQFAQLLETLKQELAEAAIGASRL
ncbi:MAG: response regulator [Leptolyngbyaceae cyanobacterium bins.349]|nr:response regulator [Leptolyngbyaceae cyanobacterium bins.349]